MKRHDDEVRVEGAGRRGPADAIFVGPTVRPGRYAEMITHYRTIATIEAACGVPHDGQAATAAPVTGAWLP